MFRFASLVLLYCVISISAGLIKKRSASHSGEYGGNGGIPFSHSVNQLDGPITGFKIWADSSYIAGIQVKYGDEWSDLVGSKLGELREITLHPEEAIVRVSGKADRYIRKLQFLTNTGRRFSMGTGVGTNFSAHPLFQKAVLSYISGRAGAIIDAISFHWNVKSTGGAS